MPITADVCVIAGCASDRARAMPKSITLTDPPGVIMTLAGFTSRCTMPWRWEKSRAAQTSASTSQARCGSSGPSPRTRSRSVRPATYSMTM